MVSLELDVAFHYHNYTFYFKHLTAAFEDVSTIVLNIILEGLAEEGQERMKRWAREGLRIPWQEVCFPIRAFNSAASLMGASY